MAEWWKDEEVVFYGLTLPTTDDPTDDPTDEIGMKSENKFSLYLVSLLRASPFDFGQVSSEFAKFV